MVMIVLALLALALMVPWLRGNWIVAALLTFGYLGVGGGLALEEAPASFAIVVAILWLPLAIWSLLGRKPAPLRRPWRGAVAIERH